MPVWTIGEQYNVDYDTAGAQNDTITVLSVTAVKNQGCDVETKEVGSCFAGKTGFKVRTREVYAGHVNLYDWYLCPFHYAYLETLPVPNVMDTLFPDDPNA